jgi:hypothetical protein
LRPEKLNNPALGPCRRPIVLAALPGRPSCVQRSQVTTHPGAPPVYRPTTSALQRVIEEWSGKKLKEFNGELDDDQHLRKQQGMTAWKDLLRKDDQNPDIALSKDRRLFVRLSKLDPSIKAQRKTADEDSRTIIEDCGSFWGEL